MPTPPRFRPILILALLLLPPALWAAPPGQVSITLEWVKQDFPARVRVFEPARGSDLSIWQMGTAKGVAQAPVGREITGPVAVAPGEARLVVLVVENPGPDGLYFFAAPHQMTPPERALGVRFKCVCTNQPHRVPPKSIWYRVLQLKLYPDFVGDSLTISHTLVGISAERARHAAPTGADGLGGDGF